MRNDTVLSVLGIRNQDVIRMIRGQRGCGTGIHGVRSGVELCLYEELCKGI